MYMLVIIARLFFNTSYDIKYIAIVLVMITVDMSTHVLLNTPRTGDKQV